MGPLDMVLAKDRLCEALEKIWGHPGALGRVQKVLSAATGEELEERAGELGMELMDAGRLEEGWSFARTWKAAKGEESPEQSPDEEDEAEDREGPARKGAWSLGLGKAFSKADLSTTDELASASTGDHPGEATQWSTEEEGKRGLANGKVGLALAKAELAAVARSRLGSKAGKIVARVEQAADPRQLALAVGESQRKLVKAGLPRLAAKMAKKWLDLRGRLE